MKLKKMVIVSLSTMVFGSFFPSFVNVIGHTENGYSVFAQEDKLAILAKIKTNLLTQEPIVETQLAKVDNEDLLKFYESASNATPWQDIYHSIASHYSQLGLISDSAEIAKFKSILAEIISTTGKSAEELKNVDPKVLISEYDSAKQANPDDATKAIQEVLANVDLNYGKLSEGERAAVKAAESALVETTETESTTTVTEVDTTVETTMEEPEPTLSDELFETTTVKNSSVEATEETVTEPTTVEMSQESITEETEDTTVEETISDTTSVETSEESVVDETTVEEKVAEETTTNETTLTLETTSVSEETEEGQFRQKLLERTDITAEQLSSITSQELSKISEITGLPLTATDDNNLKVFRRAFVTYYPERFTTQQIYDVANTLREFAIAHTPMTQAIASQIPDEDFLQWSREAYLQGNDVTYPFKQAYKNYPKLFDPLLESTMNNLTTKTSLTLAQLKHIDPLLMMLLNWEAAANVTTYEAIEKTLLENYQSHQTDTTTVQSDTTTTETTHEMSTTSEPTTTQALQVSKTKQVQKGLLPQTGEQGSLWIVIVALILAGGGFILLKNKRK
ncbi:LPXTG cell wall anchor domain-containing protein [Globicatella sanguinis]|uniref:LPXTG cell wall anchor domain-containing protein n=1 Tax=Globicatella sanguinis TaxID=13076 RepID=UPI002542C8D4|nr:LPXTG cell wall anchor domain-containing protein [Globicatella sanguinis]MDK7630029.1 LPXTG cell wall anchor domain-containing protein [Globicatella sanguinis]WIK65871.1 LPXTG cell wall anchor domain-containing protein [Globicatella sanguinis]WKT55276.1 LPXTG cell wall anchor domain-containing protein [Globicatella sanguinis]